MVHGKGDWGWGRVRRMVRKEGILGKAVSRSTHDTDSD